MSVIRTTPDTRPTQRHYRPEVPAARQQGACRCERGHDFEVTFAAGAELPQASDCRCGARARRAGGGASLPPGGSDHERRMAQLRGRRSSAELEQILADRLAELAAMRKAAQP